MTIQEILKNFPEITLVERSGELVIATVSRDEVAKVATRLNQEYNLPLSSLFATDDRETDQTFGVHVIFSLDEAHEWLKLSIKVPVSDPRYPSLTEGIMAAHWYERYLADMFGIIPEGHPDPRRLVHHENIPEKTYPLRKDFAWNTKLEHANVPYPMHHIVGEGVYEIPVGPIHAGIIEPGHFRFNVAGERIMTLEGKLFFTHKGVEKMLEGKTAQKGLPYIERLSGDMSSAHALSYCQAVEKIAECNVPERALFLRALFTELERLTMHIHDLANIGGMGTGYSFIAANGFRIKERLQRLSMKMTGNRFWRGIIIPGGTSKDFTEAELKEILSVSKNAWKEMRHVVNTALSSEAFLDRLQTTGVLPLEAAKAFGAVGLPARASGLDRDVRRDHPYATYGKMPIPIVTKKSSDVFARYRLRRWENDETILYMEKLIANIPQGNIAAACEVTDGFALGAVESWRGEILCALQIKNGVIIRCFPRDPSFCNWALFGIMGPGNIVPDFPLINKSLNLSYSGTDM